LLSEQITRCCKDILAEVFPVSSLALNLAHVVCVGVRKTNEQCS